MSDAYPAPSRPDASVPSADAYRAAYRRSLEDPSGFFGEAAADFLWGSPPSTIVAGTLPDARWFEGGTTNLAWNCLERNEARGRAEKVALIWEGEPGEVRSLTYRALREQVERAAGALRALGVGVGDRVGIYLGMVPEAVVAMLACARLGAVHTVVFGGFAADALRDRLNDAGAKVLITQDGSYRRGAVVPLKANADRALEGCPSITSVLVVRRLEGRPAWVEGRDVDWETALAEAAPTLEPVLVPSEHPLFILYTSGTTGKPKGVLHTTAGYMVGAGLSARHVFDLRDDDVYFCTADVGWITGHTYVAYGPLLAGATVLLYEGAPNAPDESRMWRLVEAHRVTIFYTAPTAIRAFIRWGDHHVSRHDLGSLRLLGSVGEPINPEAWRWYHRVVGGGRCPVVDTWWQTETGSIMLTTLPYAAAAKPGSCGLPFFGVEPAILRPDGTEAAAGEAGLLVLRRPMPSLLRTVWGDDERFRATYFSRFPGLYFTGDGARMDADGYVTILGRVDDVLNVSGHRLGTAEVESALVGHPAVAEAAAVGRPDELTGEALVVFVTPKGGVETDDALAKALSDHVAAEIGKFARPASVRFAAALPKTRSGKIMRRLLRDIAAGKATTGDVTTLEDMSVLAALRSDDE